MGFFRNFTAPLWGTFIGNLLFFFTSVFYILWWTAVNRSDSGGNGAGIFLAGACFTGIAAIVILAGCMNALSREGKGLPVRYILLGCALLFFVLLALTRIAFDRIVTSELMIICVWAAVEWSLIAVLQGSGRFGAGRAVTLAALVGLATLVGLVCYVLHYRLDEALRFRNGLIPLAVDAGVMTVFLGVLAFS